MRLTNKEYWENNWKKVELPQRIDVSTSPKSIKELDGIFKSILPKSDYGIKLLEIGCAPGGWLDYFYKNFKYKVFGIEYTRKGYEDTLKNLKLLKTVGDIINEDIFEYKTSDKYNVVASFGLIEHFDDPTDVIKKHVELLNEGGYLILEIPNIRYLNKFIVKTLNKSVLNAHNTNIMNKDFFKSVAEKFNMDILYLDFIGPFNPYLFPFRARSNVMNKIIIAIATLSGLLPSSKFYSPYILLIAKK